MHSILVLCRLVAPRAQYGASESDQVPRLNTAIIRTGARGMPSSHALVSSLAARSAPCCPLVPTSRGTRRPRRRPLRPPPQPLPLRLLPRPPPPPPPSTFRLQPRCSTWAASPDTPPPCSRSASTPAPSSWCRAVTTGSCWCGACRARWSAGGAAGAWPGCCRMLPWPGLDVHGFFCLRPSVCKHAATLQS